MGEVYRARDTRLDRTVAIKVLPTHLADKPDLRERFEREAKTIACLNHPHICVLHDVGSQDGLSYLVMECLEGETLAKRLEKGPLPLEQVLRYGAQIADALDARRRAQLTFQCLRVDDPNVGDTICNQFVGFTPYVSDSIVGREDFDPEQRQTRRDLFVGRRFLVDADIRNRIRLLANLHAQFRVHVNVPFPAPPVQLPTNNEE